MSNNGWIFLAAAWIFLSGLDWWIEHLDLKLWKPVLPAELKDFYNQEQYSKSRDYHLDHHKLDTIQLCVTLVLGVAFLGMSGFQSLDFFVRRFAHTDLTAGLLFFGIWTVVLQILGLPFRILKTFGVEQKYGFNRTTPKTFILDIVKAAFLSLVLGAPLLAFVLWFFQRFGFNYWPWVWLAIVAFQLLLIWIAPVWILPLFNKLTPLPDGELKKEIEAFAKAQNFELSGIFTMDGSKRSSKANAFFTGFGKLKRIVLFDTLIAKHSVTELVAVLAHEIGHYRMKHIQRQLIVSVLSLGLMLALFSESIRGQTLFILFQVEVPSIYMGLVLFSLVYSPIAKITGLWSLWLSRKYEFEADEYSIRTYAHPAALADALKRLSTENLSNLTPHPLKVFLEYTHPPVLKRIQAIRALMS